MSLHMNRGRRRRTLPDLTGNTKVEFVSARQSPRNSLRWAVTINVNGWPHDIAMWAKDELDVMKQVMEMQRGIQPDTAFDDSR